MLGLGGGTGPRPPSVEVGNPCEVAASEGCCSATTGVENEIPPAITVGQGTETISSSRRKSKEAEEGEAAEVAAKGKEVSSNVTWREVMMRRVDRSRQQ
jgi:hypothetical protein